MHQRKGYMTLQKTGGGTYWKYLSVVRALYMFHDEVSKCRQGQLTQTSTRI